ncbi:MAG: hypothetical protein MJ202_09690 [Lentisphaeria bacterium]|nr:hypothetical protein [Lentisphaeria bacterium]
MKKEIFRKPLTWILIVCLLPVVMALGTAGMTRNVRCEGHPHFDETGWVFLKNTGVALETTGVVCYFIAGKFMIPVWGVLGVAILPFSLASDCLCIPFRLAALVHSRLSPSLAYCVYTQNYELLKARLADGLDPNVKGKKWWEQKPEELRYDTYPFLGVREWWGDEELPLEEAMYHDDLKAFRILLDHGAKVTERIASSLTHIYSGKANDDLFSPEFQMLTEALRRDYAPFQNLTKKSSLISTYCTKYYSDFHVPDEGCDEVLRMLVEAGYDINVVESVNLHRRLDSSVLATPLDQLQFAFALPEERREGLVAFFREHGALTYAELQAKDPEEYPERKKSIAVDQWIFDNEEQFVDGQTTELYVDTLLALLERNDSRVNREKERTVRLGKGVFHRNMTILDVIQACDKLTPEKKAKAVQELRAHGARTVLELHAKTPLEGKKKENAVADFCEKTLLERDWREYPFREEAIRFFYENLEYLLLTQNDPNAVLEAEIPYGGIPLTRYCFPNRYPMTALDVVRLSPDLPEEQRDKTIKLLKECGGKGYAELGKPSPRVTSPMMHLCSQIYYGKEQILHPKVKELFYRYLEVGFPLNDDLRRIEMAEGVFEFTWLTNRMRPREYRATLLDLISLSSLDPAEKAELETALREHGAKSGCQ